MQTVRSAAAVSAGSRVLGEIEETTLDEVLASFRANFGATTVDADNGNGSNPALASTRLRFFPIPALNNLVRRHFQATQSAPLAVSGRHRELLYVLVATLIAPPHEKAVAIVDFEGRFDPLRLLSTTPAEHGGGAGPAESSAQPTLRIERSDLDHVHILRPVRGSPAHLAACVASIEDYMLYGPHRSRAREWWGTVVIGGGLNPAGSVSAAASAQVAVTAGWKGWLRVDRVEVPTFWGMSSEEALADREKRQAAVEDAGWVATSPWGDFTLCARERGR